MDKLNTTPPYAVDAQNEYQIQLSQRKIIEPEIDETGKVDLLSDTVFGVRFIIFISVVIFLFWGCYKLSY